MALAGAGLNVVSELSIPSTNWTRYTFSLASGGEGNAGSRVVGSTQLDRTYFDNVTLTAAVPEPGAWALMVAGLAAVESIPGTIAGYLPQTRRPLSN